MNETRFETAGRDPGKAEPPTVRFSGVADAQLRLKVREYVTVYGCVRALTTAVVAVTVAVEDTSGASASQAGSQDPEPAGAAGLPEIYLHPPGRSARNRYQLLSVTPTYAAQPLLCTASRPGRQEPRHHSANRQASVRSERPAPNGSHIGKGNDGFGSFLDFLSAQLNATSARSAGDGSGGKVAGVDGWCRSGQNLRSRPQNMSVDACSAA